MACDGDQGLVVFGVGDVVGDGGRVEFRGDGLECVVLVGVDDELLVVFGECVGEGEFEVVGCVGDDGGGYVFEIMVCWGC